MYSWTSQSIYLGLNFIVYNQRNRVIYSHRYLLVLTLDHNYSLPRTMMNEIIESHTRRVVFTHDHWVVCYLGSWGCFFLTERKFDSLWSKNWMEGSEWSIEEIAWDAGHLGSHPGTTNNMQELEPLHLHSMMLKLTLTENASSWTTIHQHLPNPFSEVKGELGKESPYRLPYAWRVKTFLFTLPNVTSSW